MKLSDLYSLDNPVSPILKSMKTDTTHDAETNVTRQETTYDYSPGLSQKEYAAILLRVPWSGNAEIDEMIRESQRVEMVKSALQGVVESSGIGPNTAADWTIELASIVTDRLNMDATQ